jgi:lysyl-tRNA synthetase class 1
VFARASGTSDGPLPVTPRPLPFRTLASVVDVTAGHQDQILRILRDMTAQDPIASLDQVRPRLDCAQAWVTGYVAPEDRTRLRDKPDTAGLATLTDEQRDAIKLLLDRMADDWSYEGLETLVYGIPRLQRGLPISAPPTAEIRVAQRAWFALLYELLVGRDTGPRMPTLLLALGQDRVRSLLAPA